MTIVLGSSPNVVDELPVLQTWDLHVGSGSTLPLSAATALPVGGFQWTGIDLSWSVGDTVTLRLRAPATNNAPVFSDGTSTTRSVAENSVAGTSVGAPVTATDADSDDTLTYSLEGTDAASFTIVSDTGQIKTKSGATYDHEATTNSYTVTVKADDGNDATDTIAVTISVTNVAEQPSKPAAPTVSAVSGSATSLTASWSAPGLNGGPALTGYEVQYRAGSGTWTGFGHSDTAVTTTITGLMADTAYQVQVRALNDETPSDWSDPSATVKTNDLPELSVENVSAEEGNSLTFTVTLSPASPATVTVMWAASSLVKAGNDAVAGTDYTAASGTLTFGANETSQQVTVVTREDTTDEEDETFTLTLSSPTNAALSNGLTELEVTGTIENDDTPPELSVADAGAAEGSPVRFTVRLSAASGKEVTVGVRTSVAGTDSAISGTDFTAVSSMTLTFDPGARSKTVEVTTDDDALDEEDEETFTLTLSGASNATLSATASTATGTIRDNDARPRITIGKATANEGDGVVLVPLTLNTASAKEVSALWYVNTDGTYTAEPEDLVGDLSASPTQKVTFSAGSVSEQIRITLVDDTTDEPDETFLVQLGGAVNASFATSSNTVTIEDNDDPPTISIAADVQQRENLGTVILEVNLSEVSEKQVRFRWRQVSRSTDTATAADLFDPSVVEVQDEVIDPGTTTGGAVRTYIKDDTLDEDNETFTLQIHAFQYATAGAKTEATVTIEDDDEPPVVSVAAESADEGDPVEFRVELSAVSGKTVTVRAATSVGSGDTAAASDFTAVSETVTFIPGSELEVVSVATDGDTLDEPNETFTVTLSGPTNATLSTTDTTAKGTIVDDDPAPVVTLVLTPSSISENGGSTRVTATLSNPSSEATTVTVSAVAASPAVAGDFDLSTNRTLTIAAGSTTSTGTVTIAANDNNVDARNRMVTVSATATNTQDVAGNPDDETLTIEDDEATPAVTLSLSASPIGENGGTTVATASLSGPSSEATTVTLTAAPGDWTADGGDRLTIPAGATQSDGSVTLTAVNDATDAPNKVLTVTASAANALGVNQPAGVALEITDDEAAPTATLAVSAPTIGENGGEATVSVKLDHPSSEATTLTVTAAVADPKAAEFTLSGAVLTVPAGDMAGSSTATLTATNNETDAPDQTVTVMARAENTQGIAGDPADVSLTITNDEASPTVTLILSPLTIGEAGETATVTAALSHPSSEATTVVVRVEPEPPALTVVLTQSGSALTIAAGETTSIGTRTVTAVPNDVDAPHRRVTVSAAADNKQGLAGHPADVTLTISDDDERGFVFSPEARTISDGEVVENAYTVALTSEPTATVTVTVTSGSGDLALSNETFSPILDEWDLTFTPDNWDVPQALSLVAGDDADSVTDTVVLRHAALGGDYQDFNRDYTVTITDTDAPTRNIVLSVDRSEVSEGAGAQPLRVRARLDGAALTAAATVAVAVGTGTAETSTDFAAAPARFNLTIAPGEFAASRSVTLTPVADALVEGDETVTVSGTTTATQEGTTTLLEVTGAQVTIADDDARGVTVAADDPLGVDEAGSATYTVVLDSEPTGEVTVTPEVTGDPDVTVAPAVLIFTASTWHVAQGVTVSAADDDDTVDDTATVTHAVAGADYGSNRVTAASVAVSVGDDDALGVTVSTGRLTVPEGESMTYTVVLASAPSVTVTVRPTVSGDPDVTVAPSRLTFTAGNWDAEQPVTVTARADADSEDDTATVSHAVTGVAGLTARAVAVLVIDDDEASTGIMLRLSPETVPERGAHTVTVTASLNGAALTSDTDVSVQVRAGTGAGVASATDFAAVPAALVLTIRAGETEARGTFRLTPVDDALDEGDGETVEVTGSATVSGTLAISVNALTIVDDDGRGLEVSRTALTVTEASSATYTVRLASLPTGPVTVAVSVTDNSDVTVRPGSLEFSVANWSDRQTVTVEAADDPDGDAETATVTHAATGGGYDGITGSAVAVAVRDNDRASRTVQLAVDPETVEEDVGAASLTVTATLDGAARATETEVALAATGGTAEAGTDFDDIAGETVTIPPGSASSTVTFFLQVENDDIDEGDGETVRLGGSTEGLTVRAAELTIVDDDERGIVVSGAPVTLVTEEGSTDYTVRLASAPTGPVTVRVTVSRSRDVTVQPSSLAFTADTWDTEQTVTVRAAHDDDASHDMAELRHAAAGADYRGVTGDAVQVIVADNDQPGLTVTPEVLSIREGSEATYTVVLNTQPTGTVTVSAAAGSAEGVTVSPSRLAFSPSNWARPQTVTVTVEDDGCPGRCNQSYVVEHTIVPHDVEDADYENAHFSLLVEVTASDTPSEKVTLAVSPQTVREGAGATALAVTAALDGAVLAEEVEVTLSLESGTALAGTDFEAVNDVTLTIPAGAVRATARMTLTPVDDAIDGRNDTETVTVSGTTTTTLSVTPAVVGIADDDTRALVVSPRAVRIGRNGEATYTVRLATRPSGGEAVMVRSALHAPPEVTVAPDAALRFTTDDWNVAQTVTVTVAPGTMYRDNETAAVVYTVSGADYGSVAGEVVVTLTPRAPPRPSETRVTLAVSPAEVPEDGGAAEVTVTAVLEGGARSVRTEVAVTVSGETAETGTDFAEVSGFTVTIPAGETQATGTFTFEPVDDALDEGDGETVTVVGTGTRLQVSPATLTLTDDDERGLELSLRSLELDTEGVGSYTVALKSQPTGEVTVTPVVTVTPSGPGSGLARATRAEAQANEAVTVTPPALTFTEEDWDVPQTVTVHVPATLLGGDETLAITHMVSGADYDDLDDPSTYPPEEPVVISPTVATVMLAVDPAEVPEDGGAAEVTVTAVLEGGARSVRTEVAVTVSGETAETGTDFAEVPGFTVTVPAGATEGSGTFELAPVDDKLDEGDGETVAVVGTGTRLQVSPATLTLTDDDERGLALSLRSLELDAEGVGSYTVALKSQPTGEVTVTPVVTVTPSGPGSGLARATRADVQANEAVTVTPPALTFTQEDWNVPQTVTVDVPATILGGDETLAITHMVSGADYDDVDDTGPGAPVVVISRPSETRVTLAVSPAEVPEDGGAAEVTVTAVLEGGARSVRTEVAVTVSGETAETGTDFAEVSGFTVTIPAGETQATGTFTVEPVDDALDEGDGETVTVVGTGTRLQVSPATLTLTDDDERGLELPATLTVAEGGMVRYEVSLSSQPVGGEVRVGVSVPGDGRLRVTPSSLTFTVDDWDVARTVTVEADEDDEASRGQVQVRHEASGADYEGVEGAVTVTVIDRATVVLSVDPETVPEEAGATPLTVTGTLDAALEEAVELTLVLRDGTAQAELDYEPVEEPATLTIPAGELTGTTELMLRPVNDDVDEGDGETVRVEATAAGSRVSLAPSSLAVTIGDDDRRGLMLSAGPFQVDGEGVVRWQVWLLSQPTGEVVVSVTAPDAPSQVAVEPPSLTFTPSSWKDAQTVTLRVPLGLYRRSENAKVVHTPAGADYSPELRQVVTVSLGRDAVAETVPAAWLSRFGRTVAGQAVDMVGSRLEDGGSPHVRLGGIGRLGDGGTWVESAREGSTWTGLTPLEAERTLSGRELLLGSSFKWSAGGEAGAPAWTAWGRFAAGGFEADEDRTRMDGDVTGAFLGMDVAHERWLAGLAVAVSEGDGEYELLAGGETGEVESSLMSLYPYGRYRLSERVDVWGLVGYGTGTMTVGRDAGETDTGIEMQMGAVGARTKVPAPVAGLSVVVKADALWLRLSSEEARDARGGDLDGADAQVSRLRLVVEGTRSFEVGGGTLTPTVELGLRHDGGDAETGTGLEVGGGLRYAGDGFTIEGSVRGLLAHDDSGYKEWGASGALRIEPDASGRGFSLTVAPAWGAASSAMDRLWSLRDTAGLVREDEFEAGSRLETELGYGLRAPLGAGVLTPYTGLTLSEGGARTGRLGSRWEIAPGAAFGLEASREEGGDDALMLRGRLRW